MPHDLLSTHVILFAKRVRLSIGGADARHFHPITQPHQMPTGQSQTPRASCSTSLRNESASSMSGEPRAANEDIADKDDKGVTRRILRVYTGGKFASSVSLPVPCSGFAGAEHCSSDECRGTEDAARGSAHSIARADRAVLRNNGEIMSVGPVVNASRFTSEHVPWAFDQMISTGVTSDIECIRYAIYRVLSEASQLKHPVQTLPPFHPDTHLLTAAIPRVERIARQLWNRRRRSFSSPDISLTAPAAAASLGPLRDGRWATEARIVPRKGNDEDRCSDDTTAGIIGREWEGDEHEDSGIFVDYR